MYGDVSKYDKRETLMKTTVKIGIRPVIDGRWGGIREGLEEQTMGMAVAAKELIESCLLYTSPSPRDYAASRMPSSA